MRAPSKSNLFDAARTWDADRVGRILAIAPQLVRATDQTGRTALHIACAVPPGGAKLAEPNGIKTVTALLKANAELEAFVPMPADEGDFRANALWYAVSRGRNLPLVRFLLRRGADASYSLWSVVFQDDPVMCRELLRAKPRLDLVSHGETPIFLAARTKRVKTLPLLIEAGADPSIKDPRGRDAVDIARARRLPRALIERLEALKQQRG